MKKTVLCLSILAKLTFAQSIIVDGFSSPESVIIKDENLYLSNVGEKLEASVKDGDGFISKLSLDGKIKELKFIKKLNAPKGMGIIENTLYIADIDTLKGFDLDSKKEVFSLVFKDTKFLNDITIKDKNTLYLSASDVGAIFEVNLKKRAYKKLIDLNTANGLYYDDGILYTVKIGSSFKTMLDKKGNLYKIDLKNNNKLSLLSTYDGILDGIQKVDDKIYVSDWVNFKNSGIIRIYDLKTKKESVLGIDSLNGPADFIVHKTTKKLYVPQMLSGKLSIIDLSFH